MCHVIRRINTVPALEYRTSRRGGQFLAGDPELLRELYERDASAFAVYGRSLVVVNDRVRPTHVQDWGTVLRYPSTLSAADFEDYVSSLTGTDFLRPGGDPAPSAHDEAGRVQ